MKAITILENEFKKNHANANEELKVLLERKLKHCYATLKIASSIFSLSQAQKDMLLLHDIGRFNQFEDSATYSHAVFGSELLKGRGFDIEVVLPIKYHETDIDWQRHILNDSDYVNLPDEKKRAVLFNTALLKDIDIIANMEEQVGGKVTPSKRINPIVLNNLSNGAICDSRSDVRGEVDRILYILCGLFVINLDESKRYINKKRIARRLFDKANKSVAGCPKMQESIYKSRVLVYNTLKWLH